jgi:glutamate formiminotransferase/formiminotetrahydrofolate cyclodeaminase
MDLCPEAVAKGNTNVVSDAGVAVLMAEAALRGAALNVMINLKWIKDEAFVTELQTKLDDLLADSTGRRDEIYAGVIDAL